MLEVKARCLKGQRKQRGTSAAAPSGFFFRLRNNPAAEPVATNILGEEKSFDKKKAERRAPEQPANGRAGIRVRHHDRERAMIPISHLCVVLAGKPIGDDGPRAVVE